MSTNPLFPQSPDKSEDETSPPGYLLPGHDKKREFKKFDYNPHAADAAVQLAREQVQKIYDKAPDAGREIAEAKAEKHRSQHQQFMYELSMSGKSLADIQTEWYAYYTRLPDDQKHQVWQEFYEANTAATKLAAPTPARTEPESSHARKVLAAPHRKRGQPDSKHVHAAQTATPRSKIRKHISERASKLSENQKRNLHSLAFGLASGLIVLAIVMFGFFNEVIIAPFIQPGRAAATPIIVDDAGIASDGRTEIIIPKINVQIPVVYNVPSNDEAVIENNLMNGVVHYPTTVLPGQTGNAAFFGHSSNNIFNQGKYKFAFVLLHTLVPGDTFYLTYNNTVYAYKVISRQIVEPSQVSVLNDIPDQIATATLITCDPPGTSLHRLVVVGQQINPDPSANTAGTNTSSTGSPTTQLASNGPTLWSRLIHWLF